MTTDYRDLITRIAKELDNYRQLLLDDRTATHRLSDEARAALGEADEPAVPESREPAAVTGQLSDEELLKLAQQYSVVYLRSDGSACHPFQEGYDMRSGVLNFARAVLAHWGNPAPTPPADGEVAELVAWLRETGDTIQPSHLAEHQRYKRAAELLERQVLPEVGE